MPPTPKAPAEPDELTLDQVALKADAAMAQALAIAEEAGELIGALSKRVADLEASGGSDTAGLAERVALLERHTTVPQRPQPVPSKALCDDCGAPADGLHFDDCKYLSDPAPKGPRGTLARMGEAA